MGDFNSQPSSIPINIMRLHANMSDSFVDAHPSANSSHSNVSPEVGIQQYGMSCDSTLNSWSASKPIPAHITSQGGKRLDYIFHRPPAVARRRPLIWGYRDDPASSQGDSTEVDADGWPSGDAQLEQGKVIPQSITQAPKLRCTTSQIVFTENVPGKIYSYSDHFGLFSTFAIDRPPKTAASDANPTPSPSRSQSTQLNNADTKNSTSFTPLVPLLSSEAEPLTEETTTYAPIPPSSPVSSPRASTNSQLSNTKSHIIRKALDTLRLYTRISQRGSASHLRICAAAILGLIALTVGSAWQPKSWLQPIFTLLGGLLGAAGATFLYTGFVWGKWELGLLTETMEEMELELRVVEMEERGRG